MINPKKKKRPYLDYDLEGYIKGQQTARTDATSNQQATTQRQVAENNTSEKVQQRRVANERRKTQEAYEKGKRDYERQQQAAKVQEDIESRPWWNPTTVLRNAKGIPIFGAAPTATEWAYGLMNKAVGNDEAGDYYMQDADKSATGQAIALAAIPAHTNPYTAAMYDTALLAPWAKELDAQGKFYHPETLTGEEAAMLGLSVLPFGLKYKPQLSYAKATAKDALQSNIPWIRNNARWQRPKGYVINDDGTVTFDDCIERTTKATEEIGKIANTLVDSPYQNMDVSRFPEAKYKYNPRTGEFDIEAPLQTWVDEGEPLVQKYYESPEEYNRMIASGASPEDATLVTTVRALNAENRLPSELVDLGDDIFGQAENINGQARIDYNNRTNSKASNTFLDTLLSTIFHELGGHGSSLNVGYGTQTIPEHMVPILQKIYKHNEALRPKLKPIYQAIKDGDYEAAKRLAETEDGILKGTNGEINFKEIKDLIDYMEDVQEYSARAQGTNMGRYYGVKNNWNTDQLYKYFTKETVDNLLKNVWQVGLPLVGGGTLLYNTLDNNQQVQKQKFGGRILPPWHK